MGRRSEVKSGSVWNKTNVLITFFCEHFCNLKFLKKKIKLFKCSYIGNVYVCACMHVVNVY